MMNIFDFFTMMSVFGFLKTLGSFLIVLTVVVFFHEMGHYIVGRFCGIGVEKFSIGFGKEIIGFTDSKKTRWSLSLVPLGGYVKFIGDMDPAGMSFDEENMSAEKRKKSFFAQAPWKKILTVFAGPFANFLLSFIIFVGIFYFYGSLSVKPVVEKVQENSPAFFSGLQVGDQIMSMNDVPVRYFEDIQVFVAQNLDQEIRFKILRQEKILELSLRPDVVEYIDEEGQKKKKTLVGIASDGSLEHRSFETYGILESFKKSLEKTSTMIVQTGFFLKNLILGLENHCNLGGPIKIADMAGKAAEKGLQNMLNLIAVLSTGIGVLNLFPLPPLDGGHIVFYSLEWVVGRPLSKKLIDRIYQIGFFLLMSLMAFVFWNDLFGC